MAKKSLFNVKIDPEFEKLIDPLTDEEYQQLKENIREHGLLDRILVWRDPRTGCDLIIDGHNRFRILKELSETGEFFIDDSCFRSVILSNRDDVKEYIIKNQLGRRNLTREQKLRLIGQMQENRKQSHGGQIKGMGQNEPSVRSTAEAIAKEVGVSESTVKRAEKFSKGIDAIQSLSPEAANKVLKGKASVNYSEVASFPKMNSEEQNDFIELIVNPEKKKKKAKEPESFVDAVFSEVEKTIPNDTIYVSVPMSKKLFNAIKEVATFTGESPDELIERNLRQNLNHDVAWLLIGTFKSFGDDGYNENSLKALGKKVAKATGVPVDEWLMNKNHSEMDEETRKYVHQHSGNAEKLILPKKSEFQEG